MNILRLNFNQSIDTQIIKALHYHGLNNPKVDSIQNLIEGAGGENLEPVYQLSEQEIIHDNYGLSRIFKLYLKPDIDIERAIQTLQKSPLIEKVKPISVNRAFDS